jgi:FkbM family methyltransferase
VDCGSNYAQGIDYFSSLYPPRGYDYVLIEPNPACQAALAEAASKLRSLGAAVDVKPLAAWDREEVLRLEIPSLSEDPRSLGASIVTQPDGGTSTEVSTLDLGQLLEVSQADYSHFVVKMDIEGAELRVLPRMFDVLRAIGKPATLYVEFHSYYRTGEAKREALRAEKALVHSKPSSLKIREWH